MFKKKRLLIAIIAIGLFIRVYGISEVPLYGDELTMAYDSYSILKTGRDATGEFLPLTFKMGAGRPGGYIYASLPFVALFGPSALGVRSLSVLSGLGMIILMYFLGKKIFSEKVGIFASFMASLSPWDVYLSRGGFEAHFALFLATFGIVAFLYVRENHKIYLLWGLSWGFAIHTYPTYKLTLPLLFVILLLYIGVKKVISNRLFIVSTVVLIVFGGFAAREVIVGGSEGRFLSLNVFADRNISETIIQKINFDRNVSTLPANFKPIFYNKAVEYGRMLLENHIESISNQFLFLRGDRNPRHNPGEMGMLYLIELPLLFISLIYFSFNDRKNLALIFSWILIVPLATMLLSDPGHGLRNSFMIPPFILVSSYALSKISSSKKLVSISIMLIQLVYILQQVYFIAPKKFASFWSLPAKEAVFVAQELKSKYENVFMSDSIDNIEYAYPVYAKIEPNIVINQYGKYPKKYDNVSIVNNIGNIESKYGRSLVVVEKDVDSENFVPGIKSYEVGE